MGARWFSRRALGLHLLLFVVGTTCLLAGWWQLHQALDGNSLSWAYTVEWPVFAVIALVAWWQLIHETTEERATRAARAARDSARQARADRAGSPAATARRSWRDAALDAYDKDELTATDSQRIAEAAEREYSAHLARYAGQAGRPESDGDPVRG